MLRTVILACILGLLPQVASAELIISNWNISNTQVSMDINGTIDPGFTPSNFFAERLYLGVPNDADWNSSTTSATFTPLAGATNSRSIDFIELAKWGDDHRAFFFHDSSDTSGWAAGESINGTIVAHGSFTPANINPSQLVVQVGFEGSGPLLKPSAYVGGFTAVPEPSGIGIAGLSLLGFAIRRRRSA